MPEYLIFLAMVASFILLAMATKLPISISIALSAAIGSILGGEGISLRHLIEGSFGYFDTILIIATAMVFMKVLQASGILDSIAALLLKAFYKRKALLLLTAMVIVMFPGMITGSSTTAVLSSGPLIAPVLMKLGLSRLKTGAFITMGAILGMIAPPVNILVMIMGGGVDMPYVGITLPLLIIVTPLVIIISFWLGYKNLKTLEYEQLKSILPPSYLPEYGFRLFLPLLIILGLMVAPNIFAGKIPDIGIPAIFLVGSAVGIFCGRRFNFLKITQNAIEEAMPILSLLAGVGMFIQVMTLTGARGWTVVSILSFPSILLYLGIAISMPLFGGVSAFGSASILGVPFILALIDKNALITSAALSAIVGLGDLIPPAAMASRFGAKVVEEPNFLRMLRPCIIPALIQLSVGVAVLLLASSLDKVI